MPPSGPSRVVDFKSPQDVGRRVATSRDPTRRFTGLADAYARHRPTYPAAAVEFILERCGLGPGSVLVDVGCGTGISSRLFAARGLRVIGVEPNAEMRAQARAEPPAEVATAPEYRDGRAEATGLPAASADAVLAAQAFHWFDPARTLPEFHRVLRPAGWTVLLWNTRDDRDPFTAAYGHLVWSLTDRPTSKEIREDSPAALRQTPLFETLEPVFFANEQRLDEDGLLGRAFSASYAPREPPRRDAFAAALRDLFRANAREGLVALRYRTEVHLARRRETLAQRRSGAHQGNGNRSMEDASRGSARRSRGGRGSDGAGADDGPQ